jgi:hypothetical protein
VTRVPLPVDAKGGPAFAIWHRVTRAETEGIVWLAPFATPNSPVMTQSWSQSVECLDRAWHGQLTPITVTAALSTQNGGLIELDDAGLVHSDRCP